MSFEKQLRGQVQIQVSGAAGERFFTLCAREGILFSRIEALDADCFHAWISAGDFFALRKCAAKTNSRIRVLQKRGLPFAAHRAARRWAMLFGILASIAAVLWLTSCVWTIHVEGCKQISETEILQLLEQAGLKTGARRAKLSAREIRNDVIAGCDKLSYLTVNFRGVKAYVQVWERDETPEPIPQNEPCDILADKTGVILRLRVRQGTACVQVGDAVQPGDRIAEGKVYGANGELHPVHAMAQADIRTYYTIRAVIPAELESTAVLEELRPERSLLLGKYRFSLQKIENTEKLWYDKQIEQKLLHLHEDFHVPIGVETVRRFRCVSVQVSMKEETLRPLLEERMLRRLMAAKPDAQLCGYTFSWETTGTGAFMGVLHAELVETCGVEVPAG